MSNPDLELAKKVKRIEIKTRRLTDETLAGQYHSAFKGRGMTFSEVREYRYGDDLRNIDWNVTARFNTPYVKIFEEERELTVILLIDVSASAEIGSVALSKKERIAEIAGTLAFSAIRNNDKVGVIMFSDKIEKYIPPKKGQQHILRIIRELITFKPEGKGTDIAGALKFFNRVVTKRGIVFLISDFVDEGYERDMAIAVRKHDFVAMRIADNIEKTIINTSMSFLRDAETGKTFIVEKNSNRAKAYMAWWNNIRLYLDKSAAKYKIDVVDFDTENDFVKLLVKLFKKREKRI
ncbi:MAG: DUF58 domain-containing protein [Bacteroidales bacterium]|nr:DUF58 domain-containing protein [Bacteroidales bacterium]